MRVHGVLPLLVAVPLGACGAGVAAPGAATPAPSSSAGAVRGLVYTVPEKVTAADAGRRYTMRVGQRFTLELGDAAWSVQVADQGVVSRVPNIMMVGGAQGEYQARAAGVTTLAATSSGSPPFEITLDVVKG